VSTTDISVLHSAEVAHFTDKSCYPIRSADQVLSSHFQGITVWVHYEAFTNTPDQVVAPEVSGTV
jgi:hypothetical protein